MLYFLTCFYIGLYYVRPFDWLPGLRGLPIFSVLGVVCILALFICGVGGKNKAFKYKTDLMVLGFVLAIVFSHLRHGYLGGAYDSLMFFFPSLVAYFLIVYALDSPKKIKFFVFFLICLSSFLAIEAYLQITTGYSHGGMEPMSQWFYGDEGLRYVIYRARWFGTFNDPNDLGLALVISVPFLVNMLIEKKLIVPLICLPIILYGIYLTDSRGSILALIVSVFVYFVLRTRSVYGVIFGLLLAVLIVTFGPSRMAQLSSSEGSAHGRLEAWYAGYQMFKSFPLFGVGRGAFTEYYNLTAHNSFVLVMAELGLFGLYFFLGLFYHPIKWVKNTLFTNALDLDPDLGGVVCAIYGSLFGMLIAMFFLSRSYILLPFALIATIVSISSNATSGNECCLVGNEIFNKNIFILVVLQIVLVNIFIKIFI
ncbi:O-antigen ligase family protein [Geopsychrobacter electrodiphilus]|uniref:O-antigen ligase family protein n=1 Tax=Geopsychrobacter electrodiphilus TaxID=225196 RepID=UPI00036BFCC6|nr:O-antigen ligase family protein [Geopsychrobacter electrodiphilus]